MPRSKNPNPRQVMEGDGKNTTMDCGDRVDNEVCEAESVDAAPDVKNGPDDEDQSMHLRGSALQNDEASLPVSGEPTKREPQPELISQNVGAGCSFAGKKMFPKKSNGMEHETSLDSSPSNPFFSRRSPTLVGWGERMDQGQTSSRINETRKPRSGGSSVFFNPKVMTWMRNRFQMRPGGRISASDIIALYKSDTEHLEDPPPGLQNYQVGQLLRRVFPNITRCKVTVDGRRPWVYKHLNLVENPPADLFEESYSPPPSTSEENGECINGVLMGQQQYGVLDSPSHCAMEGYDDFIIDSSRDPMNDANSDDLIQEKSNEILLGLLSKKIKMEPLSPNVMDGDDAMAVNGASWSGNGMPRKKRDSEVNEWLKQNYKYKSGYYVKSMDLLRKYNNGRVEMVKYLSQVGRVMKQVFPRVRHLRKSFKGGKREWIYLNLKPIDVDSDSEEGRRMVMPAMRRSTGWGSTNLVDDLLSSSQQSSQEWKQERVNLHDPLSILHKGPNMIFKPKTNAIQSLSHSGGSSRATTRSTSQISKGIGKFANNNFLTEGSQLQSTSLENCSSHQIANKTRVILYNERDRGLGMMQTRGASNEIERDIFAPFVKWNQATMNFEQQKILSNSSHPNCESSSTSFNMHSELDSSLTAFTDNKDCSYAGAPLVLNFLQRTAANKSMETRAAKGDDESGNGLDLSMKRPGDQEYEKSLSNPVVNGLNPDILESPTSLNFVMPLDGENILAASSSGASADACLSQTIHYRPSEIGNIMQDNPTAMDRMTAHGSVKPRDVTAKSFKPHTSSASFSFKRRYVDMNKNQGNSHITWQSLQTYNAQKYGWVCGSDVGNSPPQVIESGGRKSTRFMEWFIFTGQLLINGQRAMKEIKIYEDWTVAIHALGRRVYPNDLGGITDLEKTSASLNKVFRVLAEARLCVGFPSQSVCDVHIHGILVSKVEVWSSREEIGEEVRQRAVNCQILYSGTNPWCSKCARILKLHQQQRGTTGWKRNITHQLTSPQFPSKRQKTQ